MKKEALYHRPMMNYAHASRLNEIQIRFRTGKDDVEEVVLFYGVKFDWQNKKNVTMSKLYADEYFDYYQYNINENDIRLGYYFEVKSKEEVVYYTEAGILDVFDDNRAHCLFFQYPSVHKVDLFDAPSWVQDALFYQIFVERFYNGKPSISPENTVEWSAEPTPTSFYGGDIVGITKRLEYLSELGINAIYLTPIFKSSSNHKYDTIDYMEIDEHFGTKDDFRTFVHEAHERGIKIILDAVFNHCSEKFEPFQDVIKHGEASIYKDWFYIREFPVTREPANYETFATVPYMPRFNTSNRETKEYLLTVAEYWTKEFGIDGWRLDVADEPDHWFWREFRKKVKDINKDIFIIGENWHDAMLWLLGDQFDTVMNYSVTNLAVEYFAKGNMDSILFTNRLVSHYTKYSDQINQVAFNLLDSHDTERFLFLSQENKASLKNAAAFLYGYVGIPCTYYGTEIGLTGGYDPGCRRGFNWNINEWDNDLLNFYKRIIKIRGEEEALKRGTIKFLSTEHLFIMERELGDSKIFVVINQTDSEKEIPYDIMEQISKELISNKDFKDNIISPMTSYYLK